MFAKIPLSSKYDNEEPNFYRSPIIAILSHRLLSSNKTNTFANCQQDKEVIQLLS